MAADPGGDRPATASLASYVAECFWSGVTEDALRDLDERARACADVLTSTGDHVRYLGSLLMREDEVVMCRLEGSESSVRRLAECAAIPFERIVEVAESPWHDRQTSSDARHQGD